MSATKGRLYLYASRSTHGLPENAEDGVLVFFTGGCWQQLLYLLLFPRKKRQSFPLAGEKQINQNKYSYAGCPDPISRIGIRSYQGIF